MSDSVRPASNSATLFTLLLLLLSSAMLHIPEQEIATAQTKTSLTTTTPASNMLTYKSSNYGFIVHYPDGWQKVEFNRGIGDGTRNTVVNFLSPLEGPSDTFREYLIIQTANVTSQDLTLKGIYRRTNNFFKRIFSKF